MRMCLTLASTCTMSCQHSCFLLSDPIHCRPFSLDNLDPGSVTRMTSLSITKWWRKSALRRRRVARKPGGRFTKFGAYIPPEDGGGRGCIVPPEHSRVYKWILLKSNQSNQDRIKISQHRICTRCDLFKTIIELESINIEIKQQLESS